MKSICGLKRMPPDSHFNPPQLKAGIRVEMEHTSSPQIAKQIAKAHLLEDKHYYIYLDRMERSMKKKQVSFKTRKGTVSFIAKKRRSKR